MNSTIRELLIELFSGKYIVKTTINLAGLHFALHKRYWLGIRGPKVKGFTISRQRLEFGPLLKTGLTFGTEHNIDFLAYKQYVMKGFNENATNTPMDKAHAALATVTELGEAFDHIKKDVFHGAKIDPVFLAEEMGDAMWSFVVVLCLYDLDLVDVLRANKAKLDVRYPNGRKDLIFRDKKLEYEAISKVFNK